VKVASKDFFFSGLKEGKGKIFFRALLCIIPCVLARWWMCDVNENR